MVLKFLQIVYFDKFRFNSFVLSTTTLPSIHPSIYLGKYSNIWQNDYVVTDLYREMSCRQVIDDTFLVYNSDIIQ